MPSPFPGMNPYLENRKLWRDVHHRLITALGDYLSIQLRPKYIVAVEIEVYKTTEENIMVGVPDVSVQRPLNVGNPTTINVAVAEPATEPLIVNLPMPEIVKQGYLEIIDVVKQEVVTAIELISPANKRSGKGRLTYEKKRLEILGSSTHLVEIDLLRSWQHLPFENGIESDYRILVSRANHRPNAELYAFNIQNNIPKFPIPLKPEDIEPVIDLHELLNGVYDRASYDLRIDYNREPTPPFTEKDAIWADNLLRQKQCRQ